MSPNDEMVLGNATQCLRGLIHHLSKNYPVYDLTVKVFIDPAMDKRNRGSARGMACAGFDKDGTPRIGVCRNLNRVGHAFLGGVLIHELTHLAYKLVGDGGSEVDTDATIIQVCPEARYCYGDCQYEDWRTGRLRIARNLQRVDTDFAVRCLYTWADSCPKDKVKIQRTKRT
jgi:hypothetical protein